MLNGLILSYEELEPRDYLRDGDFPLSLWDYNKDVLKAGDWVHQSYAKGVPMGGDLPTMLQEGKGTAPTFLVWAVKDPSSANLDRIQIIKGWTQNGQSFEKIFDVAWATASRIHGLAAFPPSRARWTCRRRLIPMTRARRS